MKTMLATIWFVIGFGLTVLCVAPCTVIAEEAAPMDATAQPEGFASSKVGVLRAAVESLTGDVYAEPSRWQPLSMGSFFSEGWNEPWVSPPTGAGYAPRHGWLEGANADGVFYRLNVTAFGYGHGTHGNGDQYVGVNRIYLPLSRRFEMQYDMPFVASKQGSQGSESHTGIGDFVVTPRFLLSETRATTQSFNLSFRTPTGDSNTGNGVASVSPNYQFWTNFWKGLVLRGNAGITIPYHYDGAINDRTAFFGTLAAGYYFTPHECTPVGDLVGYVAANFTHAIDNRKPTDNTDVTIAPGFRTHLGQNWFLLGGIEFPVTEPKSFDYSPSFAFLKIF